MVYGLVYVSEGGVVGHPIRGIVHKPDLRLGFGNRQVDGFDFAGG